MVAISIQTPFYNILQHNDVNNDGYKVIVPICDHPKFDNDLILKILLQELYLMLYSETSELQEQNAKQFSAFKSFPLKNILITVHIVQFKAPPYSR